MVKSILYTLKCLIVFLLFFYCQNISAQNNLGKLKTKIDTNSISIGDQFNLDISLEIPTNISAKWPLFSDTLSSKIEIIKISKIDTLKAKDKLTLHQKLTITSFDSGKQVIPVVKIETFSIKDTNKWIYFSDSLFVNVNSPAVDTTKSIKDIKEILSVPLTWKEILPWAIGGFLLIVLILAIIFFVNRYKNNKPLFSIKEKPAIPPHEWALSELANIKNSKLWQAGQTKLYYTKITDTLRKYIELSKGINAMEMTSDEIYVHLKLNEVDTKIIDNFKNILTIADYVKFAKMDPLPEDHDRCMIQAIEIVNLSKPIFNEPIIEKQ
ncbi:MAG: hypothetical protein WCK02_13615 [Bacteroidota bacterium]